MQPSHNLTVLQVEKKDTREAVRLSYEATAVIKQQLLLSNNSNTTASAAVEAVGVSLRITSQQVEKKDGGRIIDNRQTDNLQIDKLQIDNRHIDNLTNFRQIDNRLIDNLQIDNLSFSKIDSAIPLSWPRGLGNWHHGVVIFIMNEAGISNSFILASYVRGLASWCCYLYHE